MKKSIFAYLSLLFASAALTFPLGVFAAEIPLYDQPNAGAKVVGNIDTSVGVIPIYTPTNSEWVKVGDPRNGNVGWLKSADLSKAMGSSNGVTFSQKIINDGKGQNSYQVQYGQTQQSPNTQPGQPLPVLIPNIKVQPMNQQQIQKTVDDAVKQINTLYQQQLKAINNANGNSPIMPIIILPGQNQAQPAQVQPNAPVTPVVPVVPAKK